MNLNPTSFYSKDAKQVITQITIDAASLETILAAFESSLVGWPTEAQWSLRNQLKIAIDSNAAGVQKYIDEQIEYAKCNRY